MGARAGQIGLATVLVAGGVGWLASFAWSADRIPVAAPIVVTHAFTEVADTVRRNETLSEVFARQNIVGGEFLQLLSSMEGINPRRVMPNTVFEFRRAVGEQVPERVRVRVHDDAFLRLDRASDGSWDAVSEEISWAIHTERVTGAIVSSLNGSLHDAIADSVLPFGAVESLVSDLADGIFGWQIDFTRDIYPGDRFVIVYERLKSSLDEVRYGRILAAVVQSRGRENTAYVLTSVSGANEYYDEEGLSLRRAFKIYPARFRRISSNFSPGRFHPVLRTRRPHLGTDYAAATGTEIEATGAGTVIRAGRWGTYGIMVAIRHPKGIETRYGHMSSLARGIRSGVRVEQGDVIGYVGMTGLANGPHVHYEFLKNGRHLNPRSVDFGDGDPIPASRRAEFDSVRVVFDRILGRSPSGEVAARVD